MLQQLVKALTRLRLMAALLLSLSNIALTFGGDPLFTKADLSIAPGARIALAGRNGSGKSTLMKIAAGFIEADGGECFINPGVTVRYLEQEPSPDGFSSIGEYAAASLGPAEDPSAAIALLEELELDPAKSPSGLSGGEWRRTAIARALAGTPDVVLLDEPTNHLDLPAIAWLERKLSSMKAAMVIISHDRRFLENVSTQTAWLDRGETRMLNRGFAAFEDWRDKVLEEEEETRHKLGRKIVAEEHWMRYGVTARRKRNMRRVGELQDMRKRLREERRPQGQVQFSSLANERSGKRVIVAEAISKSYEGHKIVEGFSTEIARGDRIGVVGPNGAGKTTLINMLTGRLQPDAGTVELGASVEMIFLDQRRDSLDLTMRVADAISDGRGDWVTVGDSKKHVASYLKDFLFTDEQWRSPVSALSGGERARLALAAALAKPSNLLVLDEPTNDLDLETLDLLEDLIASYKGALLLVSHDRSFLDRIVQSVITTDPEKPEVWRRYAGGYDDMIAQRGSAPGLENSPLSPKPPAQKTKKSTDKKAVKSSSSAARKLSYKEQYALEKLPGEMEAMQQKIVELKQTLADPNLFSRDPALFDRSAKSLSDVEEKLAAAEEEWLRIEMKREELDGS